MQPMFHQRLERGLTLSLTVGSSGARTWSVTTYADGKQVLRKIGRWPEMKAAEARAEAFRRWEHGEPKEAPTFEQVADLWYATKIEQRGVLARKEFRRLLDTYVHAPLAGAEDRRHSSAPTSATCCGR